VFLDYFAHRALNAFRFVAVEAGGFDRVFQFGERRIHIILRCAIFPEQRRRDDVDAFVRRLRRENGRYEELQRGMEIQLAMRGWINFWPRFQKVGNALANSHAAMIRNPLSTSMPSGSDIAAGNR
jgi:hypothetical protein